MPLNMSHQLGKVLGAQIPEEAKVQILSTNARRILNQSRK
jgi:predicted TIM-barrel fold metal-dependent hydrolase